MQRYCTPCSEARQQKRSESKGFKHQAKSNDVLRGIEISKSVARKSLTDHQPFNADDGWMISFKVPFTGASSKNYVWSLAGRAGHVFKRQESRQFQDIIALKVKDAARGIKVYQNKIWISLFVQKPHHKGDAINVIDVIADGLKVGLGVDDRWFCLRQLDWEIAKTDPQIFITVCQTQEFDAQACSHCGRVLPLAQFGKKTSAKLGVDRVCRACRNAKAGVE